MFMAYIVMAYRALRGAADADGVRRSRGDGRVHAHQMRAVATVGCAVGAAVPCRARPVRSMRTGMSACVPQRRHASCHIVMVCIAVACVVMACVVVADVVMAYMAVACVVMAYRIMA